MKNIILIPALLLTGCSLITPQVKVVEMKVPVAVIPHPPEVKKPTLETATVSVANSGYDGYVKALESDLIRMENYSSNLETILNTYSRMSEELQAVTPKDTTNGNSK